MSSRGESWRLRGYSETDLPAIVDLINFCDHADGLDSAATLDDLRQHFATPGLSPERQVVVVEATGTNSEKAGASSLPSGSLIGFGRAFPGGIARGERTYGLMMRVRPEWRGQGLEHTIARHLFEIIKTHEAEHAGEKAERVRLRTYLFQQHASVRRVMEEIGFAVVREGWTMSRPLGDGIAAPEAVEGISLRRYRIPDDNRDALDTLNESFVDYFDTQPLSEDRWSHEMAAPYARPDLSWLAVDEAGGRVVGLSVVWVNAVANLQSGQQEGWIEGIGVVPRWRRRGIGKSLLLRSLHSLRDAGIDAANADVDAGSPAALGLFTSRGFTPTKILLQYECDLKDIRLGG